MSFDATYPLPKRPSLPAMQAALQVALADMDAELEDDDGAYDDPDAEWASDDELDGGLSEEGGEIRLRFFPDSDEEAIGVFLIELSPGEAPSIQVPSDEESNRHVWDDLNAIAAAFSLAVGGPGAPLG